MSRRAWCRRVTGRLPRLLLCLLVAVAATIASGTAGFAATSAARAGADAPAGDCDATQVYPSASRPVPGSTAVLFVHGFDSFPGIWAEGPGDPITEQAAALPGVTAWTFNYAKAAVQWVTDPRIGPELADTITCLAQATGKKVIVVAHSMGGLATQFAVSATGPDGDQVSTQVARVITIGTPMEGSLAESLAVLGYKAILTRAAAFGPLGVDTAVMVMGLHSWCAGRTITDPDTNVCGLFSLDQTPAGKALLYHSPEIAKLPAWPAGLPVAAIAANIDLGLSAGQLRLPVPIGDGAVTLGSATAHNTVGTPFVVTCRNVSLVRLVVDSGDQLCYHHNEPHNPQIEAAVLEQIRQSLPPTTGLVNVGENSNAWPVVGPDGRLWFDIADSSQDNSHLGAIDPTTGALQTYAVRYTPPGGGTVQYNGPIAVDETGHVWLAAQVEKSGSGGGPVLVRFTIATGATEAFTEPQACRDFLDGTQVPFATTEGSVWFQCTTNDVASSTYQVSPGGAMTAISLPAFYTLSGAPAEGDDGMMYMTAIRDGIDGVAEISGSGTPTFYRGPGDAVVGAIAGNGTGHLVAEVGCSEAVGCPGVPADCDGGRMTVCFYELSPGGAFKPLAIVQNVSQIYQPGMDDRGDLWAIVQLSSSQNEDLLEVGSGGKVSLYPFSAGTGGAYMPVGPPAITPDGTVWSASSNYIGELLRAGPYF
jgi:pimeloyl-ACP methyl ester carboxylesterase